MSAPRGKPPVEILERRGRRARIGAENVESHKDETPRHFVEHASDFLKGVGPSCCEGGSGQSPPTEDITDLADAD